MNENKNRMKEPVEKYIKKAEEWSKIILTDEGEVAKEDEAIFESIKTGEYATWRQSNMNRFDKTGIKKQIDQKLQINKVRKLNPIKWWNSVAAVLIVGVLAGAAYLLHSDMQQVSEDIIVPGSSMAYLEVNNKAKIELTAKDSLLLFQESKAQLDSGRIVYSATASNKEKVEYHRINVPRNGEFFVQLSDGTKVWVNSDSKLGFKTKFTGKQRVVDLEGEAYFEVAKNPDKPFIVRTSKADVRVLGTQFNVKAYADDDYTYATLNEGKVQVSKDGINEVLKPNEQLVINNSTAEYSKRKVDASIYSAWTKGRLVFKDERLEDILIALSRWYDISVFYPEAELKDRRFSISIDRYDNIQTLLDQMELTNRVRFEVNKNAVVVKKVET
jgi:ferric-dicitrate binding protein FerR (iron transport regulator)